MELKGYFFGNGLYLSAIQQGIQAKHCGDEMTVKYLQPAKKPTSESLILYDYLAVYKTVILLNAGTSGELHEINKHFLSSQNPYPFANFCESEEALGGAMTCVGIVLPEKIFMASEKVRKGVITAEMIEFSGAVQYMDDNGNAINNPVSKWDYDTIMMLNKYPLSR